MANIWNRPHVGTLASTHRFVLDKADSGDATDTVHCTLADLDTYIGATPHAGTFSPVVDTGSNVNITGVSVTQALYTYTPIDGSATHGIVDVQVLITGTPGSSGTVVVYIEPPQYGSPPTSLPIASASTGLALLNPGPSADADASTLGLAAGNFGVIATAPSTADVTILGRLTYVTGSA